MPRITQYQSADDVTHYEATRYAAKDQRFISRKEQNMITDLLKTLPAARGRILDVPCGYGRFTPHLVARGWSPVNSDLAPTMVAHSLASAKAGLQTTLTGFAASLYGKLPVREGSFDGALCVRMLHNTLRAEDRVLILQALSHAISDWVVITYYNNPLLHTLQFQVRRSLMKKARRSMAMISKAQFAEEARAAGLRVEKDVAVFPLLHAQRIVLLRKINV